MGTTKAMGAVWVRVFVIASVTLSDTQVSAGTPLLDLPGELIGDGASEVFARELAGDGPIGLQGEIAPSLSRPSDLCWVAGRSCSGRRREPTIRSWLSRRRLGEIDNVHRGRHAGIQWICNVRRGHRAELRCSARRALHRYEHL